MNVASSTYYSSYYSLLTGGVRAKYLESARYLKMPAKIDMQTIYSALSKSQSVDYEALETVKEVKQDAVSLKEALLSLTRAGTSTKAANISEGEAGAAFTSTQRMVSAYNRMLKKSEESASFLLRQELSAVSKSYAGILTDAGISVDMRGYLYVDREKLLGVGQDGALQEMIENPESEGYGFFKGLLKAAEQVEKNPASYLSNLMGGLLSFRLYAGIGLFYNVQV